MALRWSPLPPDQIDRQAAARAARAVRAVSAGKSAPVAAPRPPVRKSPYQVLTDAQIQAEADKRLEAMYASQTDPIKRAAAAAAARALGAQQAEIGFTTAGQHALGQVGSPLQGAYGSSRVTAGTSPEAQQFATEDNTAIAGTGQAAGSWADQLSGIQGNLGQETLGSLIASGEQEQKDYEQQLIDLAHQRPELRGQILDQLYQNEITKAQLAAAKNDPASKEADRLTQSTGYLWVVGPDGKPKRATDKNGRFIPTVQGRAETAQEAALGLDQRKQSWQEQMDVAGLRLKAGQYTAQNKIALQKIAASGGQIDAAASKAIGHIVLKDGSTPTGPDGKPIPVAKTATKGGTPYQKAVGDAKGLRGKPVPYTGPKKFDSPDVVNAQGVVTSFGKKGGITIKGKYLASPTAKGVFSTPDPTHPGQFIRTTNDPRKAKTDSTYTFQQAVEYLANRYGLTAQQATRALRAAGWTP